jgi:hypothetical protein
MELTQPEEKRSREAVDYILAQEYYHIYGLEELDSVSFEERLRIVKETADDDRILEAREEIKSHYKYNHDVVCRALGVTRTCCMVSLRNTAIIPIYNATRPDGLSIVVDDGTHRRILTRKPNSSRYIQENYIPKHDVLIQGFFPKNAPRFNTITGEDALDSSQKDDILNAIDDLPDNL